MSPHILCLPRFISFLSAAQIAPGASGRILPCCCCCSFPTPYWWGPQESGVTLIAGLPAGWASWGVALESYQQRREISQHKTARALHRVPSFQCNLGEMLKICRATRMPGFTEPRSYYIRLSFLPAAVSPGKSPRLSFSNQLANLLSADCHSCH